MCFFPKILAILFNSFIFVAYFFLCEFIFFLNPQFFLLDSYKRDHIQIIKYLYIIFFFKFLFSFLSNFLLLFNEFFYTSFYINKIIFEWNYTRNIGKKFWKIYSGTRTRIHRKLNYFIYSPSLIAHFFYLLSPISIIVILLNFYHSFSILFSTHKSPKTLSILFEHRTLFKSSQTKFERRAYKRVHFVSQKKMLFFFFFFFF